MSNKVQKKNRILDVFWRLIRGEYVSIQELSKEYNVSTKSISRDISEIKNYLCDYQVEWGHYAILYSYQEKAYYLETDRFLCNKELLAILKILIASRSLDKELLKNIIYKMESLLSIKDKKIVHEMITKELYHYMPVGTKCEYVLDHLWNITRSIKEQKEISIEYYKMDGSKIIRKIKPLSIAFSEYYFYLIASHTLNGEEVNRFYRIDRITKLTRHRTGFRIDYSQRFDEGELKNRIQYMWPGSEKYRTITFEFQGPSVKAILDKLPGAEIIWQNEYKYIIRAKTYGDGIKMVLLSQGKWVKVLEPQSFVEEMKAEIIAMKSNYD